MRRQFVFVVLGMLAGCAAGASGNNNDTDVPAATDLGATEMDSGAEGADSGPVASDVAADHHDAGSTPTDTGTNHTDGSSTPDVITLESTPGQIYCYATPSCSGATPVCCDAEADGGYTDTCIATVAACGSHNNAYQCAQAADCPTGNQCCTSFYTASSGTMYLNNTICASSCTGTMAVQMCVTDAGCPSGMHCVAQHISGRNVGTCM